MHLSKKTQKIFIFLSFIAAITKDKVQLWKCIIWQLRIIHNRTLGSLSRHLKTQSSVLFIMNSSRSHKANGFQPFGSIIDILFNSPYSPFLDPVEEMFELWKYLFHRSSFLNHKSVIYNICLSTQKIKEEKLLTIFSIHSIYINLSIRRGGWIRFIICSIFIYIIHACGMI